MEVRTPIRIRLVGIEGGKAIGIRNVPTSIEPITVTLRIWRGGRLMRRGGYLINMTVLLLLIPLLLLAATYESISSAVVVNQAERGGLMERQYFSTVTLRDDLQNAVDLSFKRAYIALTEYVINHSFVSNASEALEELMKYGTIGGNISPTMGGCHSGVLVF
ncbi:hypothetical protein [Thermococcus sp. JCM 11816]|uniref:hypothetical protein n=1 Tax=Thermococcus sp. (strain JCM 11816 / KS-1) TaxID=1295125 RepID=UPI000AFD43E6